MLSDPEINQSAMGLKKVRAQLTVNGAFMAKRSSELCSDRNLSQHWTMPRVQVPFEAC